MIHEKGILVKRKGQQRGSAGQTGRSRTTGQEVREHELVVRIAGIRDPLGRWPCVLSSNPGRGPRDGGLFILSFVRRDDLGLGRSRRL